jgi:hypothetical protein
MPLDRVTERLHKAIVAAVPAVTGVSVGAKGDSSTVTVHPASEQAAAQATIDAFDWSAGAQALYDRRQASRQIGYTTGVRLTADRATTSATYQDCTGLSFELEKDTHYAFNFDGAYNTAAGTTGIQLALNGPATSFLGVVFQLFTSTTAVLAAVSGSYDSGVNATASAGATNLPFSIYGNLTTTAAGLLVVRFRSEVDTSQVQIRRGSQGVLYAVE